MNVLVDATSMLLRGAGVRKYVHGWLLGLRAVSAGSGDTIRTYPVGVPVPVHSYAQRPVGRPLARAVRMIMVYAANARGSPIMDLAALGNDVFHASQHANNLPRRTLVTATIFDFSCWRTPQSHTAANVQATLRYAEKTLKRSDGLIAISAHACADAEATLGIPRQRIRVIYPGVADQYFDATPEQAQSVRAKYGLDRAYFVFVGCIEPRKNVTQLIRAFQKMPEATRRDVQLVLAGPFGWETEELRRDLDENRGSIKYLGYVPEGDLPGLYRGATALVYPSQYEGFGLPVAEAMAVGVPVITSNRSALPEVVGDAGVLVDPDSVEHISAAMRRVLMSNDWASSLAARGKDRAQNYHWARAASESLRFFHDVYGK